jgi:hypothetical protein|tara:strand:- start:3820 stop:3969 length:150 start_codon:yes stop_codon:yes gene_type:complete
MEKIKNFGLSIGIFGCLFKLMAWQGATVLLTVGLTSLASYFFLKIFEKN